MKEVSKSIQFQADLIDMNGEIHSIAATEYATERYYSIKKLNQKVQYMDLIEAMAYICSSSMDIKLFGIIFSELDENNSFHINITKRANELQVSRVKLTKMLKKASEIGFLHKLETGHYMVNPYIIRGTKFKSNQNFEQIQQKWTTLKITQPTD